MAERKRSNVLASVDMDAAQSALVEKRLRELPEYLAEESDRLVQIATEMAVPDPYVVAQQAWTILDAFAVWIGKQEITPASRTRVGARTAFFLGTYAAQRYECAWVVMKDPQNPAFGRYVVITKASRAGKSLAFDVFGLAKNVVMSPDPAVEFKRRLAGIDDEAAAFLNQKSS